MINVTIAEQNSTIAIRETIHLLTSCRLYDAVTLLYKLSETASGHSSFNNMSFFAAWDLGKVK